MDQKFWDKIDSFRQNREYDKIISKIKEEIPEFWDKMDISEEDGEYDKAIREIKNLPTDKIDKGLIYVLGRAYMYSGDFKNALNTYLSFIGKAKEDTLNTDIWLYSEAGWTCNEFEDFEQGLKYLLEAEKLGRDDEWLNTEIGQCLGRLERYEEAIKRLEKSLELIEADEAENGDEKVNEKIFIVSELGYLHAAQGKNEEALKYFYTAKDLGRNDGWIYLHLYHNLKTTKGEEEALKYFEEQAKIEDKNPVLLEALGNIYMLEAANYEKAEKTFQKAFALSGDGQQLFNRGRALAALKKYEEAIEVLLQSRRISEQEGDVTDGEDMELVRCYIGLKDKKNAEKYLELAREGADNVADEFIDEYEEELDRLEDLIDEL